SSRVRRHLCSPAEWNAGGSVPRSVVKVQRGSRCVPGEEMTCTDCEAPGKLTMCLPGWLAALDACDGEQLRLRVAAARYLVASSSACAGSSPGLPLAPSASAMPVGHWTTESKPRRAAHGPVVPHADRATPQRCGCRSTRSSGARP